MTKKTAALMAGAAKIFDRVNNVFAAIAVVVLAFLMLSVTYAVIIRYWLNMAARGMFEIWTYSMVYLPFLGAAWLLNEEGHVGIDIVTNRLKPRTRHMLHMITSLLVAIIFLAIAYYGSQMTSDSLRAGRKIPGELYPPEAAILVIVPIGSFLLFIQLLRRAYRNYREWQTKSDRG